MLTDEEIDDLLQWFEVGQQTGSYDADEDDEELYEKLRAARLAS